MVALADTLPWWDCVRVCRRIILATWEARFRMGVACYARSGVADLASRKVYFDTAPWATTISPYRDTCGFTF